MAHEAEAMVIVIPLLTPTSLFSRLSSSPHTATHTAPEIATDDSSSPQRHDMVPTSTKPASARYKTRICTVGFGQTEATGPSHSFGHRRHHRGCCQRRHRQVPQRMALIASSRVSGKTTRAACQCIDLPGSAARSSVTSDTNEDLAPTEVVEKIRSVGTGGG
jgi:hypothetical protein